MTSLRDRLRAETAPRHERVDRAYSTLDLTRRDDLRAFLRAQLSVLRSVRCGPGPHAAAATDLGSRMAAALDADLRDLPGWQPTFPIGDGRLDPTATLYILLGSSLGTRVLRRRWQQGTDPALAGAGRYLGLAPPQGAWRNLCEDLEQRPSQGAEADRIVLDAASLFDLHLVALARPTFLLEEAPNA